MDKKSYGKKQISCCPPKTVKAYDLVVGDEIVYQGKTWKIVKIGRAIKKVSRRKIVVSKLLNSKPKKNGWTWIVLSREEETANILCLPQQEFDN